MTSLCECGCGNPAPPAKANDKRRGYIKGQPVRFIQGHGGKLQRRTPGSSRHQRETKVPYADQKARTAYSKRWKDLHPEERAAIGKRDRDKLKAETMAAYGGECACCRESRLPFLTLDHPDNDGGARRKAEGHKGGTAQYRRLRKQGFPPGFRVLCANCNLAIYTQGRCPHQEDKPLVVKTRVYKKGEAA